MQQRGGGGVLTDVVSYRGNLVNLLHDQPLNLVLLKMMMPMPRGMAFEMAKLMSFDAREALRERLAIALLRNTTARYAKVSWAGAHRTSLHRPKPCEDPQCVDHTLSHRC